ncbi:unnamed protein product [Calypogeia fissa]
MTNEDVEKAFPHVWSALQYASNQLTLEVHRFISEFNIEYKAWLKDHITTKLVEAYSNGPEEAADGETNQNDKSDRSDQEQDDKIDHVDKEDTSGDNVEFKECCDQGSDDMADDSDGSDGGRSLNDI